MPHPIYISHTSQILPEDPLIYKELIGVVFIYQLPPICFWENHFVEGVYCISKFILFNKMTMFLLVISTLYVLRKMNLCKKKMLWENLRHDSRSFVSVVIILNDLLFYIKSFNMFISKILVIVQKYIAILIEKIYIVNKTDFLIITYWWLCATILIWSGQFELSKSW